MSAFRVVLLDCDLCGEVCDLGGAAVGVTFAKVRRPSGWRSWRDIDICPAHDDMTMPQALDAVDKRRAGWGGAS